MGALLGEYRFFWFPRPPLSPTAGRMPGFLIQEKNVMKRNLLPVILFATASAAVFTTNAHGATAATVPAAPDPTEIPIPTIITPMGKLPGVNELPSRPQMPDPLVMNDGTKLTSPAQWPARRAEILKIMEYYDVGVAPPPPGNTKAVEKMNVVSADGTVKYRLVHLTFGPDEKLSLDVGIVTPNTPGPHPVIISLGGEPAGGTPDPVRIGQGPNQGRGQDVLLPDLIPSATPAAAAAPAAGPAPGTIPGVGEAPAPRGGEPQLSTAELTDINAALKSLMVQQDPNTKQIFDEHQGYNPIPIPAAGNPAAGRGGIGGRGGAGGGNPADQYERSYALQLARGYGMAIFSTADCAADSTLRNPDGSWAFRDAGFAVAYPNYDWGILRIWAWGAARVTDYLVTDPDIDPRVIGVTGVSRTGKAAMMAAAFDERITLALPDSEGGGGNGAYRFSQYDTIAQENLEVDEMKYPNWYSTNLHTFWGHTDKLPFDNHYWYALVAPRAFVALEGDSDTTSFGPAVKQGWLAGEQVYDFLGAPNHLAVVYVHHAHAAPNAEDWQDALDFADHVLLGKSTPRRIPGKFPPITDGPGGFIVWNTGTESLAQFPPITNGPGPEVPDPGPRPAPAAR